MYFWEVIALTNNEDRLNTRDKIELVVQAGLQLIPVVGGALSSTYFGYKNEKRFKRLETFYEEFSKRNYLDLLPLEDHDEEVLIGLIERINEKVEHEVIEEKRLYLINYLRHTLAEPSTIKNFNERLFFIETLGNMTTIEIDILLQIYKGEDYGTFGSILLNSYYDEYAVVGSIGRLKNYGFLLVGNPRGPIVGAPINPIRDEVYKTSLLADKFISFCLTE